MKPAFVYLASASPRRQQLLQQIGVDFRLLLPDADEDAEALEASQAGELPRRPTCSASPRLKLAAARRRLRAARACRRRRSCVPTPPWRWSGASSASRPMRAKRRRMLRALSGRTHRVLTAVAVHDGRRTHAALSVSRVRFAAMPDAAIAAYVAGGEPFGKAGAYAIQGAVAAWIERIDGSHSGIMGLPLYETRGAAAQARGLALP